MIDFYDNLLTNVEGLRITMENNEFVGLNVGGQIFTTTKLTLLSVEQTFFTSLLNENFEEPLKDRSGNIFIDRSPKYFSFILDYLRNGICTQCDLDVFNKTEKYHLLLEARFYCIGPLIEILEKPKIVPVLQKVVSRSLYENGFLSVSWIYDKTQISLFIKKQSPPYKSQFVVRFKTTSGHDNYCLILPANGKYVDSIIEKKIPYFKIEETIFGDIFQHLDENNGNYRNITIDSLRTTIDKLLQ